MSAESTAELNLSAALGGQSVSLVKTWTMDLAAQSMASDTQDIGTSAELITIPTDISTAGVQCIALVNTDATNYIQVAVDSAVATPFTKLLPGTGCLIPAYTGAPSYYAKANTAACKLAKIVIGS